MRLVDHVAERFLRSRGSRLLSLIALFAGLGVMLGVAVLDVTLAVMNGFRDQIQLKFVENMPMVTVMHARGFDDLAGTIEQLERDPEVIGVAPFLRSELVITHERVSGRPVNRGAVLWGIDPVRQTKVTRFEEVVDPPFTSFATEGLAHGGPEVPGIVLGAELAGGLRALVGDLVAVHAPRKTGTGPTDYQTESREFLVVGILQSGMYEFDAAFAYMDLRDAQAMFHRPGGADGIGLRVTDMMRAPQIADRLEVELGYPPFYTNDWISLNGQLFEWIQFEKALMFMLLTFLVLIASFNVVAILITLVRDRSRDIAILRAMGTQRGQIVGVFLRLGLVIGLVGTLAGTVLGLIAIVALDHYGFPLPGEVLFVDTLPVHPKVLDFVMVAGVSMLLTFLATLLPSWLATRVQPVEVLRHE
jgi:lipoprotein-releasing system permease protein